MGNESHFRSSKDLALGNESGKPKANFLQSYKERLIDGIVQEINFAQSKINGKMNLPCQCHCKAPALRLEAIASLNLKILELLPDLYLKPDSQLAYRIQSDTLQCGWLQSITNERTGNQLGNIESIGKNRQVLQ